MILHIFYLLKNKQGEILDPPVVYAATDSSEHANEFQRTRNMSIFYYKKIKCSRKDGMKNLDRLRGCNLIKTSFLTKDIFGTKSVSVVATWKEESEVLLSSDNIYTNLLKPHLINPEIFNHISFTILKDLDYIKIWKIKKESYHDPFSEEQSRLSLKYDELSIFIKSYGWLLKEDKKI